MGKKKIEIIVKLLMDVDSSSGSFHELEKNPELTRRVFEEGVRKENGEFASVLSMRVVEV